MEQKRNKILLRKRFEFRVIVLLSSIVVLYISMYHPDMLKEYNLKQDWMTGVSGSAFVWSLVELYDFFIKTYDQYCVERNRYILMVYKTFREITAIIKVDLENIQFKNVKVKVDELQGKAALFPFDNPVYTCSDEFLNSYYYIERLMYKFMGCFAISKLVDEELSSESDSYRELYNSMIWEEETEVRMQEFRNDIDGIKKDMVEFSKIPIVFKKLDIAERNLRKGCKGKLKECVNIFSGEKVEITLKQHFELEEYFEKQLYHKNIYIFITVFKLMYCLDDFGAFYKRKTASNLLRVTYKV